MEKRVRGVDNSSRSAVLAPTPTPTAHGPPAAPTGPTRRDPDRASRRGPHKVVDTSEMDPAGAQDLAERLHQGQRDGAGAPLIDHVRRVAWAVPPDARVVAWLHEVLEYTAISELELLREGLSAGELRALRLLTRDRDSSSDTDYLAHVEMIARARGDGARIAQVVKRADLEDRLRNPRRPRGEWSPPHELGLEAFRATRLRADT